MWVGYPAGLRPMLTEFHGDPVAGGTYPALIWKSFMERALPHLEEEAQRAGGQVVDDTFDPPGYEPVAARRVVDRDGRLQLDNGLCRETREVVYFEGKGPSRTANCRRNEVDVPKVVGMTLDAARARLALQPLTAKVAYKWAEPTQRTDVVLGQIPKGGRLSSFDNVTLVLARAKHGLIPDVQGATLGDARRTLAQRQLRTRVTRVGTGPPGTVVAQSPKPRTRWITTGFRSRKRLILHGFIFPPCSRQPRSYRRPIARQECVHQKCGGASDGGRCRQNAGTNRRSDHDGPTYRSGDGQDRFDIFLERPAPTAAAQSRRSH